MHLVLCYDIVTDRRRNRLHKRLKGYLRPVQKSVFEGHLPAARYGRMVQLIERTIDQSTDTVRIYRLCRGCLRGIDLLGTAQALPTEPEDVII